MACREQVLFNLVHLPAIQQIDLGGKVSMLKGHSSKVVCVACHPKGDKIISGGFSDMYGQKPGQIFVWDAASGPLWRGDLSGMSS